jgi:hypothetical protein
MTHTTYTITDVAPLAKQGGNLRLTLDPKHEDFAKFQQKANALGINVANNQTMLTISKVVGVQVMNDLQKDKLVAPAKVQRLADKVANIEHHSSSTGLPITYQAEEAPAKKAVNKKFTKEKSVKNEAASA